MKFEKTFGKYISEKRIQREISLRGFAKMLDLSPVYICNIENGKKPAPPKETLEKMAALLLLNKEEQDIMYDLAANSKNTPSVSIDLQEYIMENDIVRTALRTAKDMDVNDEKWIEFINKINSIDK